MLQLTCGLWLSCNYEVLHQQALQMDFYYFLSSFHNSTFYHFEKLFFHIQQQVNNMLLLNIWYYIKYMQTDILWWHHQHHSLGMDRKPFKWSQIGPRIGTNRKSESSDSKLFISPILFMQKVPNQSKRMKCLDKSLSFQIRSKPRILTTKV